MKTTTDDILREALRRFSPRIGLLTEFSLDDLILIDRLARLDGHVRIFYPQQPGLDALLDELHSRYGATPIGVGAFDPREWDLRALIESRRDAEPFEEVGGIVRVRPLAGVRPATLERFARTLARRRSA